eukprot:gene9423-9589_t
MPSIAALIFLGASDGSRLCAAVATAAVVDTPVVITGAGIAGLATAVALHRVGVPSVVLERGAALRQEGSAIALWSNAWRALDAIGVSQHLRQHYLLLDRIELVASSGKCLKSFTFDECISAVGQDNEMRGVQRGKLLAAMAEQLPAGAVQFSSAVAAVSQTSSGAAVQLADGRQLSCHMVVGADGANSVVAKHLGLPATRYSGYKAYRAGMYPMTEQDAYWYICFNAPEVSAGAQVDVRPPDATGYVSEALTAVAGWSCGIQEAVRNTPPTVITRSSIRDRWTFGTFGQGCVTLAGDAAHPMTPNLGQGGCTALEDAVVLARTVSSWFNSSSSSRDEASLAAALREYEAERSARCLPLTIRGNLFGAALQIPYQPVPAIRDLVIEKRLNPAGFLDHTLYDCGILGTPAAAMPVVK